jgi:hypothetical protein
MVDVAEETMTLDLRSDQILCYTFRDFDKVGFVNKLFGELNESWQACISNLRFGFVRDGLRPIRIG